MLESASTMELGERVGVYGSWLARIGAALTECLQTHTHTHAHTHAHAHAHTHTHTHKHTHTHTHTHTQATPVAAAQDSDQRQVVHSSAQEH